MEHATYGMLVVVDDTAIRQALVAFFADEGYDAVNEAPDGMSALERMCISPQRLVVLLDWRMPGLDGIQVLEAVVADAPVARRHACRMMTTDADEPPLDVANIPCDLGVRVLRKPLDLDELLEAVEAAGRSGSRGTHDPQ
jgi:CheY-like chemotaxis protein